MAVKETNYWKIGLFVTVGVATAVGALFFLGARRLARARVERVTYFDESVQGLDVGSPVKMRGVTIGTVKDITIAPDHRLVQVTSAVYVDVMVRLNLGDEEQLMENTAPIPDDLRVQLASSGITGVKFLLVDFYPDADPPPPLSFAPGKGYLPSTPSTLKSLEGSLLSLADSLPSALGGVTDLAETLERQAAAINVQELQAAALDLVTHLDQVVLRADEKLASIDAGKLATQLSADLAALHDAITKAADLLEHLESADGPLKQAAADMAALQAQAIGLLASAQAAIVGADLPATTTSLRGAIDGYGALAGEGAGLASEARETLVLAQDALHALQALATTLERQPGALLQGRASDPPRPRPDD
jgi:phospholipid/cholesterol/gamma-HCH transport system substrate-binding protein